VPTDFEFWWRATRIWLAGADPYAARPYTPGWPLPDRLFYPGPALVLTTPVAGLSFTAAFVAWGALSGGLLAWALGRAGRDRFLVFTSAPFLLALRVGQWSPLLTAAALTPTLGLLLAAKPTLGAALFAYRPTRRGLWTGTALVALSLVVLPQWPRAWLENVRFVVAHPAPIATPIGAVCLLALARWRQPEARLLIAYACVPQLLMFADQLPLSLVARGHRELFGLTLAGWVGVALWFGQAGAFTPDDIAAAAPYAAASTYLPALLVVLRRPNVGPAPAWLEDALARRWLPRWLRGTPTPGHDGDGAVEPRDSQRT
jgi:hypothetical protein